MGTALDEKGFEIVPALLGQDRVEDLIQAVSSFLGDLSPAGVRYLASKIPEVARLSAAPELRSVVEPALGTESRLVRSILFNKTPQSNWHVTWHQDLSVAVREKVEVPGFSAWSTKEGVPHVHPPIEVLERILIVRIHLDPANHENGALWVCPGSHRFGRLSSEETEALLGQNGRIQCVVDVGDALLMRPLLLHASSKLVVEKPRRVIHLEYAGCDLPTPLEWWEARV